MSIDKVVVGEGITWTVLYILFSNEMIANKFTSWEENEKRGRLVLASINMRGNVETHE